MKKGEERKLATSPISTSLLQKVAECEDVGLPESRARLPTFSARFLQRKQSQNRPFLEEDEKLIKDKFGALGRLDSEG